MKSRSIASIREIMLFEKVFKKVGSVEEVPQTKGNQGILKPKHNSQKEQRKVREPGKRASRETVKVSVVQGGEMETRQEART